MSRRLLLALLLAGVAFFLCACCRIPAGEPSTRKTPVVTASPDAPLTYLYFSERGSYFERIQGYEFRAESGEYTACFYMANEDVPYPVPVDQAFADTLTGFIHQYGMMAWNGFSGSAPGLLDGTHFLIEFCFADGTHIQASGYGNFPANYGDASSAIEMHFQQLLPEDMREW